MTPESFANALWYGRSPWRWLLWPLAWLFALIAWCRGALYRRGVLEIVRLPVPVIVVGNITVGGVGKTPVVLALLERLQAAGYRPGVVSRGYGGQVSVPTRVTATTGVDEVGDEPRLIAQRSGCPVVVGRRRADAARLLLENDSVDVVVADDGLQHHALGRDVEIVVVDGERRFGNGLRLPAGPLREGTGRLRDVDLVLVNGVAAAPGEFALDAVVGPARSLSGDSSRPLADFIGLNVHALAGIGHPERFFAALREAGLSVTAHPFPDHHAFVRGDIDYAGADAVLMTEKDAVKCTAIADERHWAVGHSVTLPEAAWRIICARLTAAATERNG